MSFLSTLILDTSTSTQQSSTLTTHFHSISSISSLFKEFFHLHLQKITWTYPVCCLLFLDFEITYATIKQLLDKSNQHTWLPSMASLPGNPQEDGGIEDVDEEDHKSLMENVML